jgi:hypothetical protein
MQVNNVSGFADVSSVSWECIKPVIMRVRGKGLGIKTEAFSKLNEGQKAIFSFHVYFNHAKTDVYSFAYWSRLYLGNKFFDEIKKGAGYFSDPDFRNVLDKVEETFTGGNEGDLKTLYEKFPLTGERHIIIMGAKINTNREYFFGL